MTAPFESDVAAVPAAGADSEAAKQLEAYFLRRILAEVKIGQSGMSSGFAGETFQQMYSDAIADAMAEAGGLGISDIIMGQLDGAAAELEARPSPTGRLGETPSLDLGGLAVPVEGRQSSGFGSRIHPISKERKFHAGIDIAADTGTAVAAAADGVVSRAGKAGGYGNLVVVTHPGGLETRYAHLSRIDVKVGDRVTAGAELGAVGMTGTATGPHLHFEVRKDGVAKDPHEALSPTELLTSHKLQKKTTDP